MDGRRPRGGCWMWGEGAGGRACDSCLGLCVPGALPAPVAPCGERHAAWRAVWQGVSCDFACFVEEPGPFRFRLFPSASPLSLIFEEGRCVSPNGQQRLTLYR